MYLESESDFKFKEMLNTESRELYNLAVKE